MQGLQNKQMMDKSGKDISILIAISFLLLIAVLLLVVTAGTSRQKVPACIATIDWIAEDNLEVFQAIVANHFPEPLEGHYTFDAIREGVNGKSVSRQKGEFNAPAGQETTLARTAVNIENQDTYYIVLKIYKGELLLCADSIYVETQP